MTSSTTKKQLFADYVQIFFVELAYWIVSIGMVFINESVLSNHIPKDDLTIFITLFQILFSLAILVSLNHITKHCINPTFDNHHPQGDEMKTRLIDNHTGPTNHVEDARFEQQYRQSQQNSDGFIQLITVNIPERINLQTCKVVLPLSILYIGMLLLNNFCLKYVGVAFYFVSRSLTTVFNVIFTYFLINEPVSRGALICCAFIVLGFILGIDQETVIGNLSVIGVTFGMVSSLFTSLFSIYTKKTLAKLDKNIWVLVLYNNINAIVLCTPLLIVHGDLQVLFSDKVVSSKFWFLLSISGVMAFFISIVTNASIKYTSPLTHNISGTAKACLQTVIAVIYYHSHKPLLWWVSNVTILVASAAYSRIKQLEMEQRASQLQKSTSCSPLVGETKLSLPSAGSPVNQRRDSSSSGCSATSDNQQAKSTQQQRQQLDQSCTVKFQMPP